MCFDARFSSEALDPELATRIASAYLEPPDSPRVGLRADGQDLLVRTEIGCACALFPKEAGLQPEELIPGAAPQLAAVFEYVARELGGSFRFRTCWADDDPARTQEIGVRELTASIRRGKLSSTTEFIVFPD